ncbi:hypothetical protein [Spirosoma areae]
METSAAPVRTNEQSSCRSTLRAGWLLLFLLGSCALRAQTAACPTITTTDLTTITITTGQRVDSLQVNTTAVDPDKIEFVRFDTLYANPYQGENGVHLGEIDPVDGLATQRQVAFPANTGNTDRLYYIYACLKPEPTNPNCIPFALLIVTVRPIPGCPPPTCVPITVRKIKSRGKVL